VPALVNGLPDRKKGDEEEGHHSRPYSTTDWGGGLTFERKNRFTGKEEVGPSPCPLSHRAEKKGGRIRRCVILNSPQGREGGAAVKPDLNPPFKPVCRKEKELRPNIPKFVPVTRKEEKEEKALLENPDTQREGGISKQKRKKKKWVFFAERLRPIIMQKVCP